MSSFISPFQLSTVGTSQCSMARKRKKDTQIRKEEIFMSILMESMPVLMDSMTVCIENPKKSLRSN